MTAFTGGLPAALLWSTLSMMAVLMARSHVRRWIGPRAAYALWALPAVRMIAPLLPIQAFTPIPALAALHRGMAIIAVGGQGPGLRPAWQPGWAVGSWSLAIWLGGGVVLLAAHTVRHLLLCRRLVASGERRGCRGAATIIAADVQGPLAFGVLHRYVAVPRDFTSRYSQVEQDLALTHECAHHARGDLLANWVLLVVLAAHWWNPVAWKAARAFREDQELAVDAHVLARHGAGLRAAYAHVLAKAAGIGVMPACDLTARSDLPTRLRGLGRPATPKWRVVLGSSGIALGATATFAASVPVVGAGSPPANRQVTTVGIQPDGTGGYHIVVKGEVVTPKARLPAGLSLPADLDPAGGCDLTPSGRAHAVVIKGGGDVVPYTVMCGSPGRVPARTTLVEGLASLVALRTSVAAQHQPGFPETERRYALRVVDRSIREVTDLLHTPKS